MRVRERAGAGWYLYPIGEAPPTAPSDAAEVETFVTEIDKLLREEHDEDYCGIVYADEPRAPTFIKIYDPNNLGVSCGYSDQSPAAGLDDEPDPPGGPARRPGPQGPAALVAAAVRLTPGSPGARVEPRTPSWSWDQTRAEFPAVPG